MACRGFLECLLRLLNLVLALAGLGMVGYGAYLLVEWNRISSHHPISPTSSNPEFLTLARPMLLANSLSESFIDKLPKAWFIYFFIGIGVVLFVISFFGCIGSATRNGCCLSFYSFLMAVLILVELGAAAFIFFDHSWKDIIPADKTGDFDMIFSFLEDNWKIAKWVALGAVTFEALTFLVALTVRAANQPEDYDSDDEYTQRTSIQQPLINNRQGAPSNGAPAAGNLDQRPSRNDAWSTRMREKYGLDTSEFTYNPSDPSKFQQATVSPVEERGKCAIL